MKLLERLKTATAFLKKAGISEPAFDAEILVLHAAATDRLTAYRDNPEITNNEIAALEGFLARRARGEPVQYIVGEVAFLGLTIKVGKGILIPRPETELLAEHAITELRALQSVCEVSSERVLTKTAETGIAVLDLCCGSGCIALSLAHEFPYSAVFGTDISETAVNCARKNAKLSKIRNVTFLQGSLYEPVGDAFSFDIIISNPPYIRSDEIGQLQRKIKDWEPRAALDGGTDGLDFYRMIFRNAGKYLKKKGVLLLEIGYDQAYDVSLLAQDAGFTHITVEKDFAGIDRIVKAAKPP